MRAPRSAFFLVASSILGIEIVASCGGKVSVTAVLTPRGADASAEAADAAPDARGLALSPLSAGCPEDAPWIGSVCRGRGYVSCPGGLHLEPGPNGACVRSDGGAVLARAPEVRAVPKDAAADDEEPEAEDAPLRLRR